MTHKLKTWSYTDKFQCLGAECEDTCCKGWGMQLDKAHLELYHEKAPELLDAVTSGEAEHIMKRDAETDYCVKFDNGLCAVHNKYGTEFLGDACHFYPRITRRFGDRLVMSAALSCPEITRLALFEEDAFAAVDSNTDRIPYEIKDYLPDGMEPEAALAVMNALLEMAADSSVPPEHTMMRLVVIARSLESYNPQQWPDGINLLVKMADGRIPAAEADEMDIYNLLLTLYGLIFAAKKTARPRLEEVLAQIEKYLKIKIDRELLEIIQKPGGKRAMAHLQENWTDATAGIAPILRNWIQAQLTISGFPFAGFGDNVYDRAVILAVRFATVKLALISHFDKDGNPPDNAAITRIIQSISRFTDHLASPELSMNLYTEAGWTREPRLHGLVSGLST